MKEEVTKNNPMNTVELKENVTEALQLIPPVMLQRDNAEFVRRVGKCIKVAGGIFEVYNIAESNVIGVNKIFRSHL